MKKMKKLFLSIAIMFTTNVMQAQWQSDFRLTNDPAGSWTSGNPSATNNVWCIAANGSALHVVWYDYRDGTGNGEIYYKRSTDGGITWGTDTRLTNDTAVSVNPSVTVSGSIVHIVWQDERDGNPEIYYKNSTDGGITWSADTRLTNDVANSWNPSVAVFGSAVHIVWQDYRDGNYEIYYKHSTDGGITWSVDTRLTNDGAFSAIPVVTVSGSIAHIAWRDNRDGNDEIYYKHSTDGGITWSADTRLTNDAANSEYPSIAVSGSLVHVVWNDMRDGNYEVYYKNSTDGGNTWSTDTRLTNDPAGSLHTSVAACSSGVYVVWYDNRDGNDEIYYKNSTDGGITWSADTRLTNDPSYSWFPSIAISASGVHVVWTDERNGNDEIYYKRNPAGCNTGGSICGMKYNDLNGNGMKDTGEPGLPNWQIGLNIVMVPPATTDSLGNYCFNNLPPGTYTVAELNQTGWQQTAPPSPGTYTVTLSAGQHIDSLNFGNHFDPNEACITWALIDTNLVTSTFGNINGQPESIGVGSSSPFMSVYLPYSNGQKLWVGNTGWVAGLLDPMRYIQFNASPQSGNTFTVTSVSFNYGDLPLSTNFNILNFQAYYSINNWITSTVLNSTGLIYLNTTMQSFAQTMSVQVASGITFSLRIYPYALQNGIAMTPSFAIHNNVVICGTSAPDGKPLGIEQKIVSSSGRQFSIYPNPASDIVTLNIHNAINTDLTLNIYNVIGKLISSETLRQNQQQINIGDLDNGIYFVEIKSNEWSEKQKLIIQR